MRNEIESGEKIGIKESGSKRSFSDLEDDEELFSSKKAYGASGVGAGDHATTTILNLRASLEERDATIAALKLELTACKEEAAKWEDAFQNESGLALINSKDPASILDHIRVLHESEIHLKERLASSRRNEATMMIRLSNKEQEITDNKAVIHDLRSQLKPPSLQSRQLLLDPAIHAEFTRMKKELEIAEKKAKDLADDLAAIQFTPHSKNGKMLMARCRTLQEENEEIGREASEGKIHDLETRLAVEKSLCAELKAGYQELYKYVEGLNEESVKLQQMAELLQSQVYEKDQQLEELREKNSEQP